MALRYLAIYELFAASQGVPGVPPIFSNSSAACSLAWLGVEIFRSSSCNRAPPRATINECAHLLQSRQSSPSVLCGLGERAG